MNIVLSIVLLALLAVIAYVYLKRCKCGCIFGIGCKCSREGFSTDYLDCRAKGYSKEFCVTTPLAYFDVGTCRCDNGELGRLLPGFRGECVCGVDRIY